MRWYWGAIALCAISCSDGAGSGVLQGSEGGSAGAGGAGGLAPGGSAGHGGEGGGGAGGEAACDGARPPPDGLALGDPCVWRLVEAPPHEVDCEIRAATLGTGLSAPPLEWEACGPGCERAAWSGLSESWNGFGFGAKLSTSAGRDGVVSFASYSVGIRTAERSYGIRYVVDLHSGTAIAATVKHQPVSERTALCTVLGTANPLVYWLTFDASAGHRETLLAFDGDGAAWDTPWPWGPSAWAGPGSLPYRLADGALMMFGFGATLLEPGEATPKSFEAGFTMAGAAEGDFAAWVTEEPDADRLYGWTRERGKWTLREDVGSITCTLDVGDTHVVGVGGESGDGPPCTGGPNIRFWRMNRDGSDFAIGPSLGAKAESSGDVETWGDWAAALLQLPGIPVMRVAITRLSDWSTWFVEPRAGMRIVETTVGERYLYVVEGDADEPPMYSLRVLRYDLERIDEWGTPLAPAGD